MVKSCAAPNCKNRADRNLEKGISFHLFPKNAKKRQNWLKQITDNSTSPWQPSAFSVICSEHFEENSFRYLNGKRLVKDEAFPTKFSLSKGKTKAVESSSELLIEMTFNPTERDSLINDYKRLDNEFIASMELSGRNETFDEQVEANLIVSNDRQELDISEEPSSKVDLVKSNDLVVDLMFDVSRLPKSSDENFYSAESNLNGESLSQFIKDVQLDVAPVLAENLGTSFQPPSENPTSERPTDFEPTNETNIDTPSAHQKEDLSPPLKNSKKKKKKGSKDYRGPSKRARLATTLFQKAMRLSERGFDVFLVVQDSAHSPVYWGTKRFTNKFTLSKPLVNVEKTKCYNAEQCYNFSRVNKLVDHSNEMSEEFAGFFLDGSADHTYSRCNNSTEAPKNASKLCRTLGKGMNPKLCQPRNEGLEKDLSSDLRQISHSNQATKEMSLSQNFQNSYLSEKIDKLIAKNHEVCSMQSILCTSKSKKGNRRTACSQKSSSYSSLTITPSGALGSNKVSPFMSILSHSNQLDT